MPTGIAIDDQDRVYVTDTSNNRMNVYDENGRFIEQFGSFSGEDGQFFSPQGLDIDHNGNIIIADGLLQKYSSLKRKLIIGEWEMRCKMSGMKSVLSIIIVLTLFVVTGCSGEKASSKEDTIKIGVLASLTGPLETYGKQTVAGFELGLEYATEGSNEVAGKKVKFIVEDTETKPDVAVRKATKLLEEDEVDFLVGSSSSGDTLAVLPLAEEYEKIMVVEPAVADSITGQNWNKYIFRTGRNSSQDAVAGAAAIAEKGVKIATFAQDNAYGREGIAAFKEGAEKLGATIVNEQYADPNSTDFTANIQSIIKEKPDYLYIVWAGSNAPWKQLKDMQLEEQGIKISTAAQDIASLKTMDSLIGMSGFSIYYHTLPDNEVNDWLVEQHKKNSMGKSLISLLLAG